MRRTLFLWLVCVGIALLTVQPKIGEEFPNSYVGGGK